MPINNEEFIKQAFKAGLTEDQVKSAVAERNALQSKPKNEGLLSSIYNLTAKPVVEGVKGLGELVGSAGLTLGSVATEKLAPELSFAMANKAQDIRQKSGLSGSFDQGLESGLTTTGVGLLKGAAGVGAVYDIASLGTAGSLKNAGKYAIKEATRNLLVNSGLYGTGETAKTVREGGDINKAVEAYYRGATGQGTTGIFEGITGDENLARAADVAVSVGAPILLGRQIDKVTNKIIDIGSNGVKMSVDMVKKGLGTDKITENIKNFAGEQAYKTVLDDLNANIKTTISQRRLADRAGFDIGEEYLARGLSGKFDKPSIDSDIKYVNAQSKSAGDELIRLAKEQGNPEFVTVYRTANKINGGDQVFTNRVGAESFATPNEPVVEFKVPKELLEPSIFKERADAGIMEYKGKGTVTPDSYRGETAKVDFFTKNDVDSIAEAMRQGKDKNQIRIINKWAEDLPEFKSNDMASILELERYAGKNAFTKSQTMKDQVRAQAYGELFHQLRQILTERIDGADDLLKFRNASTILSSSLERTKYSNRPQDLESKIGMLFTPKKIVQNVIGKPIETLVKAAANKTVTPQKVSESPSGLRMEALRSSIQ